MHSNSFDEAAGVLPSYIREKALAVLQSIKDSAEEIRLRLGKRPKIFSKGSFFEFSDRAVTQNDLIHLLQIASNASPHRVTENVKNGFISLPGGHRLGLCGVVSVIGGRECQHLFPELCLHTHRKTASWRGSATYKYAHKEWKPSLGTHNSAAGSGQDHISQRPCKAALKRGF
ncbi:MAG: hypothetical protein IKM51_03015, partial [Oscillospiraceae bacterium]|nr:hypothetical protein [Oscillospiraceae bacterium]